MDDQVAAAIAAEQETLRHECRADAARFARFLAPDFHEFGKSGGELGYEQALRVATSADAQGPPIRVKNLRGVRIADGIVMVKYTSEYAGKRAHRTSLWRRGAKGHWQIFHHQGTPARE